MAQRRGISRRSFVKRSVGAGAALGFPATGDGVRAHGAKQPDQRGSDWSGPYLAGP